MGDFWGIERIKPELKNDRGTSLVLVNSDRGKDLWREISQNVTCNFIEKKEFVGKANTALIDSVTAHKNRSKFMKDMVQNSKIEILLDKYATEEKRTMYRRVNDRLKNYVKKFCRSKER